MKTTISILFSALTLAIFSCKKEVKQTEEIEQSQEIIDSTLVVDTPVEPIEEEKETPKKKPKKKVTSSKQKGVPTFQGREARKYVRDYERYISNYRKAVKAKDMDSFLKLSKASSELSNQYTSLISKLPAEEIQKLSDYMSVKSKQIQALEAQM